MAADPTVTRRTLIKGTAALGAGLALGSIARAAPAAARTRAASGASSAPNIVVVMADDMRGDEAQHMPNLQRLVVGPGTTFTAARHNISMCSPARAGFLTGQLSKHHNVRSQRDAFQRNNDTQRTLPVWLQAAGYTTGIVGKYFTEIEGRTTPPGWNVRRQLAAKSQEQHGYEVWDGSEARTPGLDQTRYLELQVLSFLERAPSPFFLWFTPTANHGPFQAPPGHEQDYADLQWPDRREEDVTDKPAWIQELTPFDDRVLASMRRTQRVRMRELGGLDDTVAAIVAALESSGRLDETVVVFTSDNGTFWGEHRIPPGSKNMPYDPSVLVPCVVRGPGFPDTTVRQPVQMAVDLTATCVELAGASPDLALDGVSLTRVLADPDAFAERELLYERGSLEGYTFPVPGGIPPPADGVFTRDRKLVRYRSDPPVYELYDLEDDAGELRNVADEPAYAEDRAALEAALDRLLAS